MEEFARYYNKALRFLSYRIRSEKEVRDNLLKKSRHSGKRSASRIDSGVIASDATPQNDIQIVDQVIEKLKAQKFLNDVEFARMWIESRLRAKPRAMRLIKFELKQKGISNEVVESLIHNSEFLPAGKAGIIQNDVESAKKLIDKKLNRYKNLPKPEMKIKLGAYLAGKGFGWDTIKEALRIFPLIEVIDESTEEGV